MAILRALSTCVIETWIYKKEAFLKLSLYYVSVHYLPDF
ncbi:MAG: hypothetical protein IEMM0006_0866 [bacterium]|nr:MAG: hypothetical protein IEMM0006_0866 [bacterium]